MKWCALVLLAACQPISLDTRVYLCDAARPCASGYRCDCGQCVACSGAACTACGLNESATSWWRLDAVDEGRAVDCSGHGNDGVLSDDVQPTLVSGSVGGAWSTTTPADLVARTVRGGSISFWVGSEGADGVVYEEGVLDGGAPLQLSSSGTGFFLTRDHVRFVTALGSAGDFTHVALVDGTLWIDGEDAGTLSSVSQAQWARFSMRRALDEVRTFDRALTDDEVKQLAMRACAAK